MFLTRWIGALFGKGWGPPKNPQAAQQPQGGYQAPQATVAQSPQVSPAGGLPPLPDQGVEADIAASAPAPAPVKPPDKVEITKPTTATSSGYPSQEPTSPPTGTAPMPSPTRPVPIAFGETSKKEPITSTASFGQTTPTQPFGSKTSMQGQVVNPPPESARPTPSTGSVGPMQGSSIAPGGGAPTGAQATGTQTAGQTTGSQPTESKMPGFPTSDHRQTP